MKEAMMSVPVNSAAGSSLSECSDYPVAVLEDRYGGGYSGGAWLAIGMADRLENGVFRVVRCLNGGPSGADVEAQQFWSDPPFWIAAGSTPDKATEALRGKSVARSDEAILAELDRRIEQATADVEAGRVRSIEDVRARMRERYGRQAAAE